MSDRATRALERLARAGDPSAAARARAANARSGNLRVLEDEWARVAGKADLEEQRAAWAALLHAAGGELPGSGGAWQGEPCPAPVLLRVGMKVRVHLTAWRGLNRHHRLHPACMPQLPSGAPIPLVLSGDPTLDCKVVPSGLLPAGWLRQWDKRGRQPGDGYRILRLPCEHLVPYTHRPKVDRCWLLHPVSWGPAKGTDWR